ncbi:response regulator transcription factor, partial [Klebsiella pneumoniae]
MTDLELVENLSDREREVLTCVGEGLTNSEIAERLYLAETTVKTHIGHILSK